MGTLIMTPESEVLDTSSRYTTDWKEIPGAKRRKKKIKRSAVAAIFVVVAALVFILYKGLSSALVYFYTAQQAVADKTHLGTSTFRMEGVVVPGTVQPTASGVNFSIRFDHTLVPVVEIGAPPQLFQPSVPVVVVGHFSSNASNVFLSDQIMVKHSANYVAAHPSRIKDPGGAS